MEIKNAKIDYVKLYIEDHNILTFSIGLDLSSGGCALGGYALDQSFRVNKNDNKWDYERKSSPAGLYEKNHGSCRCKKLGRFKREVC